MCGDPGDGVLWIEESLRECQRSGVILCVPYVLSIKAEVLHLTGRTSEALQALEEATAAVERSEDRWWSAEIHRLRGVFLASDNADERQIQASLLEAIRIAKKQKSTSLAKRAEATYSEYCRQKVNGAHRRGCRLPLC